MKVIALSDLHGQLPIIEESSDIVVIAGDISPLLLQHSNKLTKEWIIKDFVDWGNTIDCDKIFIVAGNHDHIFEHHKHLFPKKSKFQYLEDTLVKYKNYTIYGTPWCTIFGNWAFMRKNDILYEKYSRMPENVDILITHDVPYNCNDVIIEDVRWAGQHLGNIPLQEIIQIKKPKNLCCGHLHGSDHTPTMVYDTMIRQCSILNEQYKITYEPQIFEI